MNPPETVKIGETYGRLTVIAARPTRKRNRYFLCRCACGNEPEVQARHLRSGNTKSCGCLRSERAAENSRSSARRGGISNHPLYYVWKAMLARCANPAHPSYHRYGGRGISVCPEWREDPRAFFAHMGPRPPGHSIERIDNDGDYEPTNVRWATRVEQQNNRHAPPSALPLDEIRRRAAADGVSQAALAREFGVHQSTISKIVRRRGAYRDR